MGGLWICTQIVYSDSQFWPTYSADLRLQCKIAYIKNKMVRPV